MSSAERATAAMPISSRIQFPAMLRRSRSSCVPGHESDDLFFSVPWTEPCPLDRPQSVGPAPPSTALGLLRPRWRFVFCGNVSRSARAPSHFPILDLHSSSCHEWCPSVCRAKSLPALLLSALRSSGLRQNVFQGVRLNKGRNLGVFIAQFCSPHALIQFYGRGRILIM